MIRKSRGELLARVMLAIQLLLSLSLGASVIPSDTRITDAVAEALFSDRFVDPERVKLSTEGGVVSLMGSVDDLRSKERSLRIAEEIRGVRAVVDRLVVRPVSRSDEELRREVERALAADPTTDAYDVHANVRNGVAYLMGEVDSWAQGPWRPGWPRACLG